MACVLPFPSCFMFQHFQAHFYKELVATLLSPNSEETNVGLLKGFTTWGTFWPMRVSTA